MDIFQLIESDHLLVQSLLKRVSAARNPEWRYELCRELGQVVKVHAKAKRMAV